MFSILWPKTSEAGVWDPFPLASLLRPLSGSASSPCLLFPLTLALSARTTPHGCLVTEDPRTETGLGPHSQGLGQRPLARGMGRAGRLETLDSGLHFPMDWSWRDTGKIASLTLCGHEKSRFLLGPHLLGERQRRGRGLDRSRRRPLLQTFSLSVPCEHVLWAGFRSVPGMREHTCPPGVFSRSWHLESRGSGAHTASKTPLDSDKLCTVGALAETPRRWWGGGARQGGSLGRRWSLPC